eukprot:3130373-Rhodomonas_salina.2
MIVRRTILEGHSTSYQPLHVHAPSSTAPYTVSVPHTRVAYQMRTKLSTVHRTMIAKCMYDGLRRAG